MDIEKGILPPGWEIRLGLNGRLYYYSKQSQIVQILPPPELWKCTHSLPYGWEMAVDYDNKNYYINHITQTVTYEDPRTEDDQSSNGEWNQITSSEMLMSPQPRECSIERDTELGFGFIAGSEKPVIIRSVTPGGPSVGKLLPDDQIVKIGSENVMMADRERVIELIREKTDNVVLTVLQPNRSANSSFLNPAKKVSRTIDRPKVRFADDVIVNGQERIEGSSPLLFSPGVLRIELENSEVKSFQFLTETTAGDAVAALCDKLGFKDPNLFSLVLKPPYDNETPNEKNSKTSLRGSMSSDQTLVSSSSDSLLVAPWDCLSKVVNNPAFRQHSCHFRLEFMPTDFHKLARSDTEAFRYLYMQCVNDVVSGEVFMSDLTRDEMLKLACIQMQELVLSSLPSTPSAMSEKNHTNASNENLAQRGLFRFPSVNNKLTLKYVEKEYGLRKFLPPSLVSTMQRDNPTGRNVRKAIQQHLKASASASSFSLYPISPGVPLSPMGQGSNKEVTLLQLRLQYLKILSPQHLFGGRYFSASIQSLMESDITVLVGHHYGISQMINSKTKMVSVLAEFHHVTGFEVSSCQAESSITTVKIEFAEKQELLLSMEPQAAHNFAFMVAGYCRVYGNTNMVLTLPIAENTSAPMYFGPHKVKPSTWSYPPVAQFQPSKNSVTDVSLPLDFSSPSYFYCDFSEPITPAVLSQDVPVLGQKQTNGHHRAHTPPHGVEYVNGDVENIILPKNKHENSDTNNNTSFVSNSADVTYEEIANHEQSISDSPVSSMSAGQFSDLSSPNSPQLHASPPHDAMDDLDGYLVPTPPGQRQNRVTNEYEKEKRSSSEGESDWMDLMKALDNEKSTKLVKHTNDHHSSLSSSSTETPEASDKNLRKIIVPPPPSYPPPKIERRESAKRLGSVTSTLSSVQDVKTRTCSLRSQNSNNSDTYRNRMSSFKPVDEELKVFSLTRNDVIGHEFTGSESPTSTATSPEREKRFDAIGDVTDDVTRQKLQETEDLIQYFRQRREEVESRDKTPNQSPDASQEFASGENDTPVFVSDIAAGNKRLRKAEKAAIKNRKSWAGNESPVLGKLDMDGERPMSMSNPDLSITPSQKKKNKSLLRRIFGERKTRSHSMYETSGTSSFDTAYGGRRKRRFWKFRLRRAFTWSSTKKSNRKSVIPTSQANTTPKSRSFLLRPFSKKSKSHGVLVISEPCDEVRGVDLLPSGKYTVAGTMFQVNGDVKDSEIVTVENGSRRGSIEDISTQNNVNTSNKSNNEDMIAAKSSNEVEKAEVHFRENSTRESERPMSFSTFQHAIQNGNITETQRRNSLQHGVDQQPSPCELSLTESSEHLQELRDATARIERLVEDKNQAQPQNHQPTKPKRNSLFTDSPILSREAAQKAASLPNSSLSNDSYKTSTPITATVTRKYSHKRPAPPPPPQLSPPPTNGENDVMSDYDVFSEPESLSEHSLMTEIFSCLQHTTVGNDSNTPTVKNDITSGSESALPYDENYVMPGMKSDDIESENDSLEDKQRRDMYEMFYDEMIAENSSLTLKEDDVTPNKSDVNTDDLEFGDSQIEYAGHSYDVTYDDVDGAVYDSEDSQANDDVIYDDVNQDGGSDDSGELDSDDSRSKCSKNASYDVTSDDVNRDETESEQVSQKSYQKNLYPDDDTQTTSSSNDSDVTDTSLSISPISSPDYQNLHSQSADSKNKPLGSAYFAYRHLISPLGYDKSRPNALRKKPPLPPKPIFH